MVRVKLTEAHKQIAIRMAKAAEIGGVSHVRGSDRMEAIATDQLIGQYGQLALSLYLYGNAHPYVLTRHVQNQHPHIGDNGVDLLGTNLDVKTSLMRASSDPTKYNLIVRPAERHAGTVYVLGLVPEDHSEVVLVGWATDSQLPSETNSGGVFEGAYVIPATSLAPLPPIKYRF